MTGAPPVSAGACHDRLAEVAVISLASSNVGGPGTPNNEVLIKYTYGIELDNEEKRR